MYTTRDLAISILSDDYDEALEISSKISDPDEIIDSTNHLTIMHRLAEGAASQAEVGEMAFIKLAHEVIGCSMDVRDLRGHTPLMKAVMKTWSLGGLEYFIEKTENIDVRSRSGDSAVMLAAKSGLIENVLTLATSNANLGFVNAEGKGIETILSEQFGEAGRVAFENMVIQSSTKAAIESMVVEVNDDGSRNVKIGDIEIVVQAKPVMAAPRRRI